MNSDGTASPKPDRVSQSEKPIPTALSEIIDVQIVEGGSAETNHSLETESAADLWGEGGAISVSESTTTSVEQSIESVSKIAEQTESEDRSATMSNLTQDQEKPLELNVSDPDPDNSMVDNWSILLDEIERESDILSESVDGGEELVAQTSNTTSSQADIDPLVKEESQLQAEISALRETQAQLQQQIAETQVSLGKITQAAITDLEQHRQKLQISVEQLERRRDRIQAEINKSFTGSSQEIAIRLQGFKDYLVGSLQDLVTIAEEIEFPAPPPAQIRLETPITQLPTPPSSKTPPAPQFIEPPFKANAQRVRELLHQYRTAPDYYAPTWQLRRTFEPIHMEKTANWFLTQGGRGAVRSLNSRLQNILVAAATISVLRDLYGDYLRTLVLANLPERLGDWRRGLQDCLGISKSDFGGNGGIILFEAPEALANKADRIIADKEMPLIIIDDSEGLISLSLLEYPLWLAFAPDPQQPIDDYRY
jgi:hypothetical protein